MAARAVSTLMKVISRTAKQYKWEGYYRYWVTIQPSLSLNVLSVTTQQVLQGEPFTSKDIYLDFVLLISPLVTTQLTHVLFWRLWKLATSN